MECMGEGTAESAHPINHVINQKVKIEVIIINS